MITVFYDGKCPLCAKEINQYKALAKPDIFDWHDINESTDELNKSGISLSDGLKLLHAKDHNGKLHIGANAFILIWSQLEHRQSLAKMLSLPLIRQIANTIYKIHAKRRFKRLEHCQLTTKQKGK